MEFFILFLGAMTLPGMVLTRVFRLDACRAPVSIAASLSLLVMVLVAARAAGLGVAAFGYTLLAVYGLIAGGAVWLWRGSAAADRATLGFERAHLIPAATMAAVVLYMAWAGPYTEIPGDMWWHIGHIHEWLGELSGEGIGGYDALGSVFDKSTRHWHALAAYFLYVSGTEVAAALEELALANTLLFAAGVYGFGLLVFKRLIASRTARHAAAAAAVFFFVTHFGLAVFAYVRYYAFAPTMLNYVVYLAALACLLAFIRSKEGGYRYLAAAAVFTLVAAAIHKQEAMFVVTMAGLIVLWEYVLAARQSGPAWITRPAAWRTPGRLRIGLLLGIFVLAYILVHSFAYVSMERHNPLNHGVMADIRHYLPFLQNLYVLKPNFQFYQAITVWGVLVYVLFIFCIRRFLDNSYLMAGMALPFLTVFNPVFTDFFLRFSWPEVLWRLCYALPLPFAGAYFLCRSVDKSLRGRHAGERVLGLAGVTALIGLLLPVQTTFVVSPHSKIYTLAPVGARNDHRLWMDLIRFLRDQESRGVITDPVTGYVVASLTDHRYPGYKFFGRDGFPVDRGSYRSRQFAARNGWLVVINRRDGAPSPAGRHGGHWPANVLKVSQRYSEAFKSHIKDHPGEFDKLWSRSGIDVYRVDVR